MLTSFAITPLGVGESVSQYVAEAVKIVRDSGLPNSTGSMWTEVEGEWDEVMDVIKRATEAVAAKAPRVSVLIRIDHRPSVTDAMHAKVEKLEALLGTEAQ
jgi:uncharacterized protein (TIGR00106 family)